MISYALRCDGGHGFGAWFRSSADFDDQRTSGHLSCPVCGSQAVEKALMAPAIAKGGSNAGARAEESGSEPKGELVANPSTAVPDGVAEMARKLVDLARSIRAQSEFVGDRFATEARRIHEEEAPDRSIYGSAREDDIRALIEDGIGVLPLPDPPEDKN